MASALIVVASRVANCRGRIPSTKVGEVRRAIDGDGDGACIRRGRRILSASEIGARRGRYVPALQATGGDSVTNVYACR